LESRKIYLKGKNGTGKYVLVDEDDYQKFKDMTWWLFVDKYAACALNVDGNRKYAYMHRLITNPPEGYLVDHMDGNTLDNRKCNLRIVTKAQNSMNCNVNSINTSGYKGVSQFKRTGKWKAYIIYNDVNYHLGYFDSRHVAAKAYNAKAIEFFGEYAKLNVIREDVDASGQC
jgi:hypothetical protein